MAPFRPRHTRPFQTLKTDLQLACTATPRNLHLRAELNKLERALESKERLAEGLHLIDFEQLKIENQALSEKIEERHEDLAKLNKKTTSTVQVLTHLKEKLVFVEAERVRQAAELAALEAEAQRSRDQLNQSKRARRPARGQRQAPRGPGHGQVGAAGG